MRAFRALKRGAVKGTEFFTTLLAGAGARALFPGFLAFGRVLFPGMLGVSLALGLARGLSRGRSFRGFLCSLGASGECRNG